jgi:hypothetical protein
MGGARVDQSNKTCRGEEIWREESTGLHASQFIETRRHWFTGLVFHNTHDTVNVLNLVQGRCALAESPVEAFDTLVVHYAETFIVPANVGPYVVRPVDDCRESCATVKNLCQEIREQGR